MAAKKKASTKKVAKKSKPRVLPRRVHTKYAHVTGVEIFLWGNRIGVTVLDPRYAFYAFRYTPEFRKQLEPKAATVRLSSGGKETVQLKLITATEVEAARSKLQ